MTTPARPPAPPLRTWRPMAAWTAAILLALGVTCWLTWHRVHADAHDRTSERPALIAWAEIVRAWKAYDVHPSAKTGEALLAALPDQPFRWEGLLGEVDPEAGRTIRYIDEHLGVLFAGIKKADPTAVRVGFKLTLLMDSAAAPLETLHDILGQVIPKNPTLFLAELKRHGVDRIDVGSLTCCCFEAVDDLPAQEQELKHRLTALKTVNDPGVRSERDLCIQAIEEDLRKYHGPRAPSRGPAPTPAQEARGRLRGNEAGK